MPQYSNLSPERHINPNSHFMASKTDPLTSLIETIFHQDGYTLYQLGEGMYVVAKLPLRIRDTYRPEPTTIHITWNPLLWKYGNNNPENCYLRTAVTYIRPDHLEQDDTLINFLRRTFTPLKPGLEFFTAQPELTITSVVAPNSLG